MKLMPILKNWALLGPMPGALAAAKYQQEVLRVITVLPGKYRYEQVEAAINASGAYPRSVYESLAANQHTCVLARFYEALNGPDGRKS